MRRLRRTVNRVDDRLQTALRLRAARTRAVVEPSDGSGVGGGGEERRLYAGGFQRWTILS